MPETLEIDGLVLYAVISGGDIKQDKRRVMAKVSAETKRYLVASDFDQTLSFNDSGIVLSELLGIPGFHEKVAGLAKVNLVQQGAELAYLLRHDPEFRSVRKEHRIEAGKYVRLKNNVDLLGEFFEKGLDSY